jgi:hypothetical protein
MVTIDLLFILTVLAGILAVVDGIARLRGRGGGLIVGIAELVFAVLMLLTLFVAFPEPLTTVTWLILLLIALAVGLFVGRIRRGGLVITVIALVLTAVVLLVRLGWLTIPGLL